MLVAIRTIGFSFLIAILVFILSKQHKTPCGKGDYLLIHVTLHKLLYAIVLILLVLTLFHLARL